MKKVGNHNSISRIFILSAAFLLTFSLSSIAQTATPAAAPVAAATDVATAAAPASGGDAIKGKELFNTNCAACHKLDAKMTGPALRGVAQKYDMAWIYKWVHNSTALIKSGDAAAVKISTEYNGAVMTPFPQLSEADIDNIIAYTLYIARLGFVYAEFPSIINIKSIPRAKPHQSVSILMYRIDRTV